MLRQADYERIRLGFAGSVLTLTLDRPEHGNRVDDTMHSELTRIFTDVRAAPDVRAVVLTGAGDAFCLGGDAGPERTFTTLTGLTPIAEARMMIESLIDLDQPLICAVNGDALGLGAILATVADAAFMARSARLGDRHVAGGVTAGNGSAALWPLLIGVNRAKFLLLEAAVLTADEAVDVGLIHAASDDPLAEATALAERWAALPPYALQSTKAILNAHLRTALGILRLGLELEDRALAGPEFAAVRAAVSRGVR
ncbi:enoyl-CoA hydratase/isomerase family protein [Cryptosporangium sp. NPDC048952]|uniref:enoyl-CoA hydratase/isomerase family protein n=1 Tax=Cryptosporangium sp. NPDC048952 TaxID=3363961 RepID=UPI003719285C